MTVDRPVRTAGGTERFWSPDGFITPDGLRLWNTVTLTGALAGAVLMSVAGALAATAVATQRRGRPGRAAVAGAVIGGALGSAIGGAEGWLLGGVVTLTAGAEADQDQDGR